MSIAFAYEDYQTDFVSLLEQRNFVSIHLKNLQLLITEIYKTRSGLIPPLINKLFHYRYNIYHSVPLLICFVMK